MIELKIVSLIKEYIKAKKEYCDYVINTKDILEERGDELYMKLDLVEAKVLLECVKLYGD